MSRRIAVLIAIATVLWVYVMRDAPLLLVAAVACCAAVGQFGPGAWAARGRTWVLTTLGLLAAWLAVRFAIGLPAGTQAIGELLLILLAQELLHRDAGDRLMASIPILAAAALALAMEQRIAFESLGLFSLAGILFVVALGWLAAQSNLASRDGFAVRRVTVGLGILGIAGFSSFKVTEAWGEELSRIENRIDVLLANFIVDQIPSLYPRSGTLTSVTIEKINEPDQTAIRVYADREPGYLTGRVFDFYNGRVWRLLSPEARAESGRARFRQLQPTTDSSVTPPRGQNLFRLSTVSTRRPLAFEIQNSPGRGEMVFTPRSTRLISGSGRMIRVDDFGVIHFGLYSENPYVAYAESGPDEPIAEYQRDYLLATPRWIKQSLGPIADRISSEGDTFESRVAGVQRFFIQDFTYSPEFTQVPPRTDPVTHFTLTTRKGHCELFATATVMLLRLQGIPARYVTGYVCTEKDPDENDYWLARNRNCHAWAEAWDPNRNRWILVETTPGMDAANLNDDDDLLADDADSDQTDDANAGGVGSGFTNQTWIRVLQWSGMTVALMVLCTACWSFADRGGVRVSGQALLRVNKRLAKKGLRRRTGETLFEFAGRVETQSAEPEDLFAQAARFYREYAKLLYGGQRDRLIDLRAPVASVFRGKGNASAGT